MKKLFLVAMLMICFSCFTGCATFTNTHTPNLSAKITEAAVDPAPVIMTVFEVQRFMDGNFLAPGDTTGRISQEGFNKNYVAASAKSPIMLKASETPTEDVNYLLFLDIVNNEQGVKWAKLSGYTLLIIPGVTSAGTVVRGTLHEAATGRQIAILEASMETTMIFWLGLLPVVPITIIANKVGGPKENLIELCFSDVFIQLSKTIRNRPMPVAIPASRIKIEENQDGTKRSVKIAGI